MFRFSNGIGRNFRQKLPAGRSCVRGATDKFNDVDDCLRQIFVILRREFQRPDRDAMSPPKLAADAPVLNVRQPVIINFCPAVGMKLHHTARHRRLGQLHARILQEPLLTQARLDGHTRALTETNLVFVRLFLVEQVEFAQFFYCHFARFETLQAFQVCARCISHVAALVNDFDGLHQCKFRRARHHADGLDALENLEIRFVVSRRDLHYTRAELKIHMIVADDGDKFFLSRILSGQWTDRMLPDELGVTRIARIHSDGGVARNGFWSRGRDGEKCSGSFRHFDAEVVEKSLLRFHLHLFIRQRRERRRTPVHHAFAAIDESLAIEINKHLLHAS